jgi:hypothetical protein
MDGSAAIQGRPATLATALLTPEAWPAWESGAEFAGTKTGTISLGVEGELANELTHTLHLGLAPTAA